MDFDLSEEHRMIADLVGRLDAGAKRRSIAETRTRLSGARSEGLHGARSGALGEDLQAVFLDD